MSSFLTMTKQEAYVIYNKAIDKLSEAMEELNKVKSAYAKKLQKVISYNTYLITRETNGFS